MTPRLGLGSHAFPWAIGLPGQPPAHPKSPFDLLADARRLGLRLVLFSDNLPLSRLSPQELGDLARNAAETGIAVEIGTRGLHIDDLHRHLALARRFRSPLVHLVIDDGADQPTPREVVDRLTPFRSEFASAGVRLALENLERLPSRTLVRIVEELGEDFVGIGLDAANSFGALEGPEAVATVVGPHVLSVHLKDFVVRRSPHGMGFTIEGCAAGQGRLHIPWLLDTLGTAARQPFSAILENWVPAGPTLQETIARELAWTEQGVACLRRHIPD